MTFTKEAILQRLLAAYAGPGSAEEGSFAGDVLRACADAMAELWSTEIDGLEYRAFVSTATGDWLTTVCADRGVARKDGETDEELRQRTLTKLSSRPASGNADHYRAWCTQTEEILRVKVLPLARGNGTVDIIAVTPSGTAPEAEVLQHVQAIVDQERPVGADAQVFAAQETPLDITATVVLMDGASLEDIKTAFSESIAAFYREIALLTETVSYAKLLSLLLNCPGCADVTEFLLSGGEESVTLNARSIPVAGTLTLQEATA